MTGKVAMMSSEDPKPQPQLVDGSGAAETELVEFAETVAKDHLKATVPQGLAHYLRVDSSQSEAEVVWFSKRKKSAFITESYAFRGPFRN